MNESISIKWMKIKVLIVDCLTTGDGKRIFTRDFIGSGPRYVAGFIENISESQFQTELIRAEDFFSKSGEYLEPFQILGISAMTMDKGTVKKVIAKWKSNKFGLQNQYRNQKLKQTLNPSSSLSSSLSSLIIIGGPITSDISILKEFYCDFMMIGESEAALEAIFAKLGDDLANSLKNGTIENWKEKYLHEIPGIAYSSTKNESKAHQTRVNPRNPQINKKYFTNTSGYHNKLMSYPDYKFSRVFVECLRGCSNFRRTSLRLHNKHECAENSCQVCRIKPYSTREFCPAQIPPGCGFCSTINEFGSPKSRSIDSLVQEIKELINMGCKRIVLGGPGFLDFHREDSNPSKLINPKSPEPNYAVLEPFISQLIEIPAVRDHEVQLFIENIKAGLCTNKALDLIAKIPKAVFSVGCETGSDEFANMLGRPGSPRTTLEVAKKCISRGIRVHVYFIHSLPGDTAIYAKETLELMHQLAELNTEKITLYKYQELPGSPFWKISRNYVYFDKATLRVFKKIKHFVIQYNRKQKERYVGKKFKVFLSEKNEQYPNDAMGWILEGGPKVTVQNASQYVGNFREVQILRVLSDRLLYGKIQN
ncbi:MAG: B12-binding domain-containing radical SAM protein [Promethearchaeota archaeon]